MLLMRIRFTKTKPMKKWQVILFSFVFIGFGVLFLILSVSNIKTYLEKNKKFTATTATVVDYNTNDEGLYAIVVEYEVDGIKYTKVSSTYSSMPQSIGSEISIKYNPDNPKDAIWKNDSTNIILPIFAVVFTGAGVFMLIYGIKMPKNGSTAPPIGVNENPSIANNLMNGVNQMNEENQMNQNPMMQPNVEMGVPNDGMMAGPAPQPMGQEMGAQPGPQPMMQPGPMPMGDVGQAPTPPMPDTMMTPPNPMPGPDPAGANMGFAGAPDAGPQMMQNPFAAGPVPAPDPMGGPVPMDGPQPMPNPFDQQGPAPMPNPGMPGPGPMPGPMDNPGMAGPQPMPMPGPGGVPPMGPAPEDPVPQPMGQDGMAAGPQQSAFPSFGAPTDPNQPPMPNADPNGNTQF